VANSGDQHIPPAEDSGRDLVLLNKACSGVPVLKPTSTKADVQR